jgi:hypothetical protein
MHNIHSHYDYYESGEKFWGEFSQEIPSLCKSGFGGLMFRYLQCVRRKSDLSVAEFRQLWKQYQPMVLELAERLGAAGVEFHTTLSVDANVRMAMQRGTMEPFDAIVEVSIANPAAFGAQLGEPKVLAKLEALQQFQEENFDISRSCFFFASSE